jgi:acyl-CoA-binding protein
LKLAEVGLDSLPKNGPIQTGYDEKLAMYRYANSKLPVDLAHSLWAAVCINKVEPPNVLSYDNSMTTSATVGNVTTPRPSMFDMLGRAKYDAWAKQKDLDPKEAKARYVETLLKVCSSRNMISSLQTSP